MSAGGPSAEMAGVSLRPSSSVASPAHDDEVPVSRRSPGTTEHVGPGAVETTPWPRHQFLHTVHMAGSEVWGGPCEVASGPRGTWVFAVLDSSRFWNAQRAGELPFTAHRGPDTHLHGTGSAGQPGP